MSDVLLKLLQTVQHCLTQQLASSGCSSDTTFPRNRPQLLHAGTQSGQVTTNLLKIAEKGIKVRDNVGDREQQRGEGWEEQQENAIIALRSTSTSSILPQMAADIPAACWWRTGWAVVSYRAHPDYRPGTGSYPERHRAPYRSLTTWVAVPPQSGPWLVAVETRRTSKPSSQSWRNLLASFCCLWTSKGNKHKILQRSIPKKCLRELSLCTYPSHPFKYTCK